MITVERTGAQALIQDLGRRGQAHLGVSESGAADRAALRLANRLVGNPEGRAGIECLFGGLEISAQHLHWVVVTGAPADVLLNGAPVGSHTALALRPGDRLRIAPPRHGLRSYLAVRGGIKAPKTLGSRATDVLSRLGPDPLTDGQQLRIGRAKHPLAPVEVAPPRPPSRTLAILPGPRRDWFTDDAWRTLRETAWTVTSESNRVAVRLDGPALERSVSEELPSEAMIRGSVQVPSSGQPLIFGPDHPVTGGYPVIAVLTERACDDAGQLQPGDTVRFARV